MKNRPLILIAGGTEAAGPEFGDPSLTLSGRYPEAVLAAGGLPLTLNPIPSPTYLAECVRRCDAVVLSGGDDIQTDLYRTTTAPELARTVGRTDPERDLAETLLVGEVFRQRKPVLAICRGHQMINVVFGGTLYVDLATQRPDALDHRQYALQNEPVHDVAVVPGSLLRRVMRQPAIRVNTTHHQAVDRLAELFRPTGWTSDGLVEAYELAPEHADLLPWFLAVQFHPERLCLKYPEFERFFTALATAARRPAQQRVRRMGRGRRTTAARPSAGPVASHQV